MNCIAAVDQNWAIGRNGKLLAHIPADLRYFREVTGGKVVVMGRKTLESFPQGRPLPNRINVVLTRDAGYDCEGVLVVHSMEEALEIISGYAPEDVFIIGGGQIYRSFLPYCDTAYITKMRFDGGADVFIPDLDELDNWSVFDESEPMEHDGIGYSFVEYRNAEPLPINFSAKSPTMSAYFGKRDPAEFDILACEDEEYAAGLCGLLRAYYKPLRDGFTAEQVGEYLGSGAASFESYLREKRLIATCGDFAGFNASFKGGEATRVCVPKEKLERFASAAAGGCTVADLAGFFS